MNSSSRRSARFPFRIKSFVLGALIGLTVSGLGSWAAWVQVTSYSTRNRESEVLQRSQVNAKLVGQLIANGVEPIDALSSIPPLGSQNSSILWVDGDWLSVGASTPRSDIPSELLEFGESGIPGSMRQVVDQRLTFFVTLPIILPGDRPIAYFGVTSLSDLEISLLDTRRALITATALSTFGGALFGLWINRRLMKPLSEISGASHDISSGDLKARVPIPRETDLARIAIAFNHMAESLQGRLEAEANFAATAAHELRTPVSVLRSTVDLMKLNDFTLGNDSRALVRELDISITHFEKIVRDLLDLGRQSTSADTPNLTVRHLPTLLKAIFAFYKIDLRLLRLRNEFDDTFVSVDVTRLKQIFGNLLENCTLYGGGVTGVTVENDSERIRVHIDDDGPGIDPLERDLVLRPFSRGKASTGTNGSGLGLAIVLGHLRSMNSSLDIGTSPSGGCRFSFTLLTTDHSEL